MPNALKLPETVAETAAEVLLSFAAWPQILQLTDVVISVSSGTIAAGVVRGYLLHDPRARAAPNFHLHMGYHRSTESMLAYMDTIGGLSKLCPLWRDCVRIHDEGYAYKDAYTGRHKAPFGCNPYYDAKAWGWLMEHPSLKNVLFWNIGE